MKYILNQEKLPNVEKIVFLHDPIYEKTFLYKKDRNKIRTKLKINNSKKVILYFGNYFLSKGPDILLDAALKLKKNNNILFLFVGDTKTATFDFDKSKYKTTNIRFIDKYTTDKETTEYFAAADLVVLPYRHYYKYNTSGVVIQACLAHRPILVPDISPFKELIQQFNVGRTFKCENSMSLLKQIKDSIYKESLARYDFESYIAEIESWSSITEYIIR